MEIFLIAVFALLGTAIGSFLNVCIDRLPHKKSIFYPPSHCDACHHPLSAKDLIPVFSYLWLRRRCRYCNAPIPSRTFWVEVGGGFLFALLYWHYGLSAELAAAAFYGSLFVVIMVIDIEHRLILNRIVYPATVVALIIVFFQPQPGILVVLFLQACPEMIGPFGASAGFVDRPEVRAGVRVKLAHGFGDLPLDAQAVARRHPSRRVAEIHPGQPLHQEVRERDCVA